MNNQEQIINANIEKSNMILKKFMLLYQNNFELTDNKTLQVTKQLVNHLSTVYNFNNSDFKSLIQSYKTDSEIIKNLGGKDIANYISSCLENYFKGKLI